MASDRSAQGRSNRRRGRETEARVRDHLRANGWPHAETHRLGSGHGDIALGPGHILEVKAASGWRSKWLDQLAAERHEAAADVGWIAWRRPRVRDVGRWFAIVPAGTFANVAAESRVDYAAHHSTRALMDWPAVGAYLDPCDRPSVLGWNPRPGPTVALLVDPWLRILRDAGWGAPIDQETT